MRCRALARRSGLPAVFVLVTAAAGVRAQAPERSGTLEPCELPGVVPPAMCGWIEVFEDRRSAAGRVVPLRVVVLPASGARPAPDPVYHITGGPGTAATDQAPTLSRHPFRASRDQVLVDQRGSGRSNGLFCPEQRAAPVESLLGPLLDTLRVERCRRQLEERADLTLYTTDVAMDDLDDVRRALGHDRINLHGTSYGARAALVYLRRHGEHVRSVVLNAAISMGAVVPAGFAPDAEAALHTVLAECAREPDCSAAFPTLESDYARALDAVRGKTVAVAVIDPREAERRVVEMGQAGFAEGLRAMLYSPAAIRDVPRYLHAAALGDFSALAQFALDRAANVRKIAALGLYLSITCSEDIPYTDEASVLVEGRGTFLEDVRARSHYEACRMWPSVELPTGFHDEVASDVPVLVVSGEADPIAPPEQGDQARSRLTRSHHVIVPHGGHGFSGLAGAECVDEIKLAFLEHPKDGAPDMSCLSAVERMPFRTGAPSGTDGEAGEQPERPLAR